jgi:hypothetical protein
VIMRRVKSKAGKRPAQGSEGRMSRKPVELGTIREQIKNQVGNAAEEMVAAGIEEANKGHYAAMKFLFELVGLYPATAPVEEEGQDGLATTLFKRLGVAEFTGTEVTKECEAAAVAGNDAVE